MKFLEVGTHEFFIQMFSYEGFQEILHNIKKFYYKIFTIHVQVLIGAI